MIIVYLILMGKYMRRIKKEKVINAIVYEFCLNNKYALTSGHQSLWQKLMQSKYKRRQKKQERRGNSPARHPLDDSPVAKRVEESKNTFSSEKDFCENGPRVGTTSFSPSGPDTRQWEPEEPGGKHELQQAGVRWQVVTKCQTL